MSVIYKNTWATYGPNSVSPQRSDLWVVGVSGAVKGINDALSRQPVTTAAGTVLTGYKVLDVPTMYAQSVHIPQLAVSPEVFRRGSVPYQMPGFDAPLDSVIITFLLDTADGDPKLAAAYKLCEAWHMLARAGRLPRGNDLWVPLDQNLSSTFRFDLGIQLLRGTTKIGSDGSAEPEVSMELLLENCWVANYSLSDLNYSQSGLVTLTANLYCEAIVSD